MVDIFNDWSLNPDMQEVSVKSKDNVQSDNIQAKRKWYHKANGDIFTFLKENVIK